MNFDNGGPNLHIKKVAQGCHEDNQADLLQGPHGSANLSKNFILQNIHRLPFSLLDYRAGFMKPCALLKLDFLTSAQQMQGLHETGP